MSDIWTSLVKVSGDRNNLILCGHTSAYVWMATDAPDPREFRNRVEEALRRLELQLVSMEDIFTAKEAETIDAPSLELNELIAEARKDPGRASYGQFYRFGSYDVPPVT
jgi:hypothetical protein